MGIIVSLNPQSLDRGVQQLLASRPVNLMAELEHYRRKTERLARIYDLHRRLAEKLDLASMIDAFSIWLGTLLAHELIAYRNFERNRMHISCSCHGPQRQRLLDIARNLQEEPVTQEMGGYLEEDDLYFQLCPLPGKDRSDQLLVLDQHAAKETFCDLVGDVLEELRGPLDRALAYEDLYDQARRDALTGLVNRRVFDERIVHELHNAQRYQTPLTLACIDLDHFKAVNDRMGHGEGDLVLQRVARVISSMIRDSDLLARVGGDEFMLILPNTTVERTRVLVTRICQAVAELNIQAPGACKLGASIGLACWQPGQSLEQWIEHADAALYRAKAAGRSQVSV